MIRPALLACLVAAGASAPTAAQGALDAVALDRALRVGPHAEAAQAFYRSRGHRPLWTRPGSAAPSERGRQLVAALERVADDGLDPEAYLGGPRPDVAVVREAALTRAFLHACEHLMRGRVDPERASPDWRATRRRLNAGAALRLAASQGPEAALHEARPPHDGYARLRRIHAALRSQAGTPWPPLLDGPPLRAGDVGAPVEALRARLVALGDLDGSVATTGFDGRLDAAVRRAQDRHGLEVDGVVGPQTRAALNVTPAERARQVALNLERWRWLPASLGARHVAVDAAGMTVALVEDGRRVWESRAIVGAPRSPTPGFSSAVTHVVLSPFWNVPASIARVEIFPRLARDPGYLLRHHMERMPGGRLRQWPGPDNPLGPVKFIFANPFGVRLHGTATPALFGRTARALSHGCIRAQHPLVLAEHLLTDWDAERIAAVVEAREEVWLELDAPVALHVMYWTARADEEGRLRVSPDVYGRDAALARALARAASP